MKTRDVLDRLSRRQDTEHNQALLRLAIVAVALLYICWLHGFTMSGLDSGQMALQTTGLASAAFSLAILYHIINYPRVLVVRRFLGMAHDVTAMTIFFFHTRDLASLFLFVYPFIAIGNGFRYGEKWLLISALMGATGLAILLGTSDYWANMSLISTGLAINFITVVTYTGLLLRKLRSTTAKLEELATHDSLTGLPNRRVIMDQLRHTLEFTVKNSRTIACVYFDLDGFKQVNDTLGHGAGDFLLQEVSRRTRAILRDTDLLARLGGDEFSIVLDSIQSREDAELICRRVVKAVEDITVVMGQPVKVSVSVGCVIVSPASYASRTRTTEEAVMRQADACMYQSKKSGSGLYTIAEHQATKPAKVA